MPTIPYDASLAALLHPERRATIFGTGPAPHSHALAIEAARLAYVRVEDDPHERVRLAQDLARGGFDAPTTFDDTETGSQGFATLRPADGLALVAFRGTQSDKPKDLLTDLKAWHTEHAGWPGAVHAGFARAATALLPAVTAWLDTRGANRTELLLCGHSLGGAIATLLAMRLVTGRASGAQPPGSQATRIQLVTLGSPRVGDAAFARAFAACNILSTRIVNWLDIVTRLPPEVLGYRHVGTPAFIDEHGNLGLAPAQPSAVDRQADDTELQDDAPFGPLPRRLSDHAPVNYLRAFWP